MKKNDDKVRHYLRFLELRNDVKDLLIVELDKIGLTHKCRQAKEKKEFTLIAEIPAQIDVQTISSIISTLSIDSSHYGIWTSLTSYYDNGGVRLPEYITKLHREIGGYVDFSYIIILDDNV